MLIKREKVLLDGDIALIPLGNRLFAIVDGADHNSLARYKWVPKRSHSLIYAARKTHRHGKQLWIFMHRQIMGSPRGKEIHHSNGNPLDNRRCNLIPLAASQHRLIHRR